MILRIPDQVCFKLDDEDLFLASLLEYMMTPIPDSVVEKLEERFVGKYTEA